MAKTYVSMQGGTLLLTYADKKGGGGQKSENLADIICERLLTIYCLVLSTSTVAFFKLTFTDVIAVEGSSAIFEVVL